MQGLQLYLSLIHISPEDKENGPSAVKWDLAYAAVAALTESEFYNRFASTATNNSSVPLQEGLDELIAASNSTMDTDCLLYTSLRSRPDQSHKQVPDANVHLQAAYPVPDS